MKLFEIRSLGSLRKGGGRGGATLELVVDLFIDLAVPSLCSLTPNRDGYLSEAGMVLLFIDSIGDESYFVVLEGVLSPGNFTHTDLRVSNTPDCISGA